MTDLNIFRPSRALEIAGDVLAAFSLVVIGGVLTALATLI